MRDLLQVRKYYKSGDVDGDLTKLLIKIRKIKKIPLS
jgi:hypothetical protein